MARKSETAFELYPLSQCKQLNIVTFLRANQLWARKTIQFKLFTGIFMQLVRRKHLFCAAFEWMHTRDLWVCASGSPLYQMLTTFYIGSHIGRQEGYTFLLTVTRIVHLHVICHLKCNTHKNEEKWCLERMIVGGFLLLLF